MCPELFHERFEMKRIRFWCTLLALFLLGGCADGSGSTLPKLVIGCEIVRPYCYTDADGAFSGVDADLAREACRRMGREAEFRRIDRSERDALLESGEIDCLWSCLPMDDTESYAWVGPYMTNRQVVAVPESSPYKHLADLTGCTVAVRGGSRSENALSGSADNGLPEFAAIYVLPSVGETVTALRNRYADACAGDYALLRVQLEQDGIAYRFLEEDLLRSPIGVAFRKTGSEALSEELRNVLADMYEDGTTERILNAYGIRAAAPEEARQ